MILTFREENHRYESDPPQKWVSSTKVVENFVNPFDAESIAWHVSKKKSSKWYGIDPAIIRATWEVENERSTTTGSKFHAQQENKAIQKGSLFHRGKTLSVFQTPFINGCKTAPCQILQAGCHLEHIVYSEQLGVCGQTDIMLCDGEYIDVMDYKTNKKIDQHAYGYDYGSPQCMLLPISHLEDCNYYHYAIQLSMYMYLALLKNPHLKPGKLTLIHVQFKIKSTNEFGFPTYEEDLEGNPIVTKVQNYEVPYLANEVKACMEWINKFGLN